MPVYKTIIMHKITMILLQETILIIFIIQTANWQLGRQWWGKCAREQTGLWCGRTKRGPIMRRWICHGWVKAVYDGVSYGFRAVSRSFPWCEPGHVDNFPNGSRRLALLNQSTGLEGSVVSRKVLLWLFFNVEFFGNEPTKSSRFIVNPDFHFGV